MKKKSQKKQVSSPAKIASHIEKMSNTEKSQVERYDLINSLLEKMSCNKEEELTVYSSKLNAYM